MNLLLDTRVLLWAAAEPDKLSPVTRGLIEMEDNRLYFSPASTWEMAIKAAKDRSDFQVDPSVFRRELLDNGYQELPILSQHTVLVETLPPIHRDPFDRILVAQATYEGFALFTADETVARYPGPIHKV